MSNDSDCICDQRHISWYVYGFVYFKYMAAERLGIAKTIPAYLNPELKNEDLLKGINFASGGAGYDPLTAKLVVILT